MKEIEEEARVRTDTGGAHGWRLRPLFRWRRPRRTKPRRTTWAGWKVR